MRVASGGQSNDHGVHTILRVLRGLRGEIRDQVSHVNARSFMGCVRFVVCVAANPVLAQSAQANQPRADADNGRRVYMKTGCYQCHGREGQGSPATGPRLGPNPSPFTAFAAWVRQPKGDMPPY